MQILPTDGRPPGLPEDPGKLEEQIGGPPKPEEPTVPGWMAQKTPTDSEPPAEAPEEPPQTPPEPPEPSPAIETPKEPEASPLPLQPEAPLGQEPTSDVERELQEAKAQAEAERQKSQKLLGIIKETEKVLGQARQETAGIEYKSEEEKGIDKA